MRRAIATFAMGTLSLALLASCHGAPAPGGTASNLEPAAINCPDGAQPLSKTLSSGATWRMCWSVDPKLGMVLSHIDFTPPGAEPINIISSMSLAQLEVPYDDGNRLTSDITSAGFGGTNMHSLTEIECTGEILSTKIPTIGDGTKFGSSPERPVLCHDVVDAGLSYRSSEVGELLAKRRDDMQLSTISKVGWYEYVNQVTFGADGSIRPSLGATGDLSPEDYSDGDHGSAIGPGESGHASSHSHNAVWKIDWALGGDSGQRVEQFDAQPTGEHGMHAPLVAGGYTQIDAPATADWEDRRWWKVSAPGMSNADGHTMSYQIDMGKTDSFTFIDDSHHHEEELGYDIGFTNADDCQVFATLNRGTCGRGVLDYVAGQKGQALKDVVSWVAVGYHHVPRDEEQSPMEVHWQGFSMYPRDLTAQRIDVPEQRQDLNGKPESWGGQLPPKD